jgi:Xaa-Pro aminopeptidase
MIDFKALKVDALLVSALPNIRYLTGFTGSNAMALLTPERITLITDPRYSIQAAEESRAAKLRTQVKISRKPLHKMAAEIIKQRKLKRVGFEKARLSFEAYDAMKEALPLGSSLRPTDGVIESLRMVKTADEIARIRKSVLTNSEAFERGVRQAQAGVTESDLAAEIDYQMRKLGAERTAFDTIVAAGARTALPHAHPTQHPLGKNELLLIDMGACQEGYMSDMTRMLFLGQPNRKIRSMYNAVREAQLAAVAAVRPGATTRRVDAAARDVLKRHELEKQFIHSTGHGLGLEIHEAPRVGKKDKTKLLAGMVITIEPGVYVEGYGGMRVEDTVLVTETGCEVLTPTTKELMLL